MKILEAEEASQRIQQSLKAKLKSWCEEDLFLEGIGIQMLSDQELDELCAVATHKLLETIPGPVYELA